MSDDEPTVDELRKQRTDRRQHTAAADSADPIDQVRAARAAGIEKEDQS